MTSSRSALIADRSLHGLALCEAISDSTDRWLREIAGRAGLPAGGVALAAVGGYGRGELSPQSDIDLLLLRHPKQDVREVAERIWYPIWDEGVKLGHAVRTAKEALALAGEDLDTATSLLSLRHLAGDEQLSLALRDDALALWRKRARRWLPEQSRRVRERHEAAGEVAYLLEPDVKDGRGGLRDVHAITWAEQADTVMFEGDDRTLAACYEVLLAVRVELHRRTGRPGDRLVLQEQDAVAEALGYEDAATMMRHVTDAARTIAWTSDEVWFRVDSGVKGPNVGRLRRDRPVGDGVVVREGLIVVEADADPVTDPLVVLRTAVAAAREDTRIERVSLDRLAAGTPDPFPWSAEARALLADLLLAGQPSVGVIETLDRKGIWARLLPEWEPVRSRPQRNAYHTFTVDRHLCQAAANAAELASDVDRPDLLVVGALLHDIGKGYPGDHTEVGIEVVERIARRMGYPDADVGVLVDMVRYHLLLPDVATRRDLDDEGTIRHVADAVGDVGTLRLLGALTVADSLATGPAAWNSWKAELVRVLVVRVEGVLTGGIDSVGPAPVFPTPELRRRMSERVPVLEGRDGTLTVIAPDRPGMFSRIAGVLSLNGLDVLGAAAHTDEAGWVVDEFRVESNFGPTINWAKVVTDLERALQGRLALSARLADRARTYARPPTPGLPETTPTVHFDTELSRVATVVEVTAPDRVGVLYAITSAIAELELDIRSAKVQTLGATVIDAFYVRDREGRKVTDPAYLAELERAILHTLV